MAAEVDQPCGGTCCIDVILRVSENAAESCFRDTPPFFLLLLLLDEVVSLLSLLLLLPLVN